MHDTTSEPAAAPTLRLLFVCVENANRSQMAEALARHLGERWPGWRIEAWSAGSRPSGKVNPKAVAAMAELGVALEAHHSKSLQEIPDVELDAAVTMGCGDACPMVRARHRLDWQIPDPKHLEAEGVRAVRDQIAEQVHGLLTQLTAERRTEAGTPAGSTS